MAKLRLAIVGAGPAGIYAAAILLKHEREFEVSIDLFEHLPAPYGLVRYGVAPDHPRIKGIITALREVLDMPDLKKRAFDLGIEAKASSPEEILERLKDDIDKWAAVIERAGIAKQ